MPEDSDSSTEENAANQPLPPRKDNPVASEANPGSEGKQGSPRPHWADRIIAIFTGLIFLTYIASNYFACNQMKLTKQAIDQSATNNAAAIVAQQKIAQDALTASQDSVNKSLSATIDKFHLDQRAWIGPTEVLGPQYTEDGRPVYMKVGEITRFAVLIVNSGKTPARNILTRYGIRTLPQGVNFSPKYPKKPRPYGVLQPNVPFRLEVPPLGPTVQGNINAYTLGHHILYFYGEITYDDVFKARHRTQLCMFMTPDLGSFVDCSTYNYAD